MKFQSLIAAMMHGWRPTTRAAVSLTFLAASSSCVSLIAKKNTYTATSPSVEVNGAAIRMQVKPEGTASGSYAISAMVVSAAVTTFDGPFSWRIEGTGEIGKQEYLVVHRIRTRTGKTKRDEWYPVSGLGRRVDFDRPKGDAGHVRAVYSVPGLLKVKPQEDGPLEVLVDLSVVSRGRSERKQVRFRMDPSQRSQNEFIFVPTEIVKSIGTSPADWKESGWD